MTMGLNSLTHLPDLNRLTEISQLLLVLKQIETAIREMHGHIDAANVAAMREIAALTISVKEWMHPKPKFPTFYTKTKAKKKAGKRRQASVAAKAETKGGKKKGSKSKSQHT